MKTTQLFFKTQKETPADCDVASHQLMERAGLIRRLGRGLYSYTPLMWRVIKKLCEIVRHELDREGAQEVMLPQLHPAQIWQESGRLERYQADQIIYSLQDREEGHYCLGPTHEEAVTLLVKNWLTSYKQLPVNLYQIGNKFRDEIRPRFGLMRAKEFLMADAYAFCATIEQMNQQYEAMRSAYIRIFDRLQLHYAAVEADGGAIGKGRSEEFQVLTAIGEDAVLVTEGHAANVEALKVRIESKPFQLSGRKAHVEVTPNTDTIEKLCRCLKIQDWQILKTILYRARFSEYEEFVAVSIRGDRDINEVKLSNLLGCLELELASLEELERIAGVKPGFLGPKELAVKLLGDTNIAAMQDFVVAINENDRHLVDANWGVDLALPELHDLLLAREGDLHIERDTSYKAYRGIEVGHIFNLGERYSEALQANFTDAEGVTRPFYMGCYGIGIGRLAAAIVEQLHDAKGIVWPLELAPFQCLVTAAKVDDETQRQGAELVYRTLRELGVEVLYDDRDERLGFKIKDSDLIGLPFKIIVGKGFAENSHLEVEPRQGEKSSLALDELEAWAIEQFTL